MRTRTLLITVAAAAVAFGCAGDPDLGSPPAEEQEEREPEPDPDPVPEPENDGDGPALGDIDEDEARAEAQDLLGTPEHEIVEGPDTRIMRRGDEHLVGTMDLRPGRRNLELDDDGTGTYVVTRVVVEVDGENDIVVE